MQEYLLWSSKSNKFWYFAVFASNRIKMHITNELLNGSVGNVTVGTVKDQI